MKKVKSTQKSKSKRSAKPVGASGPLLLVKASSGGKSQFIYEGKDMPLTIRITNPQRFSIGFPLAYRRQTGPIIRLIHARTGTETYLKNNPADSALQKKFTAIAPGKSVSIPCVIQAREIPGLDDNEVDLSAEITVTAEIQVKGTLVKFSSALVLPVTSR